MKKEALTFKAREIFEELKGEFLVEYDDSGAIGKRYRRQDEIGTPFCITVDFETLDDLAVTLRDRDTTEQKRIQISDLKAALRSGIWG